MKPIIFAALFVFLIAMVAESTAAQAEEVELSITGGHETDPRDHGRPVVLIGNALGVAPEVFREAFSRVRPAPAGREPEPERVRQNKEVLLGALSKYGVTNEQLDRVSNYYRYRPESGRLWPTTNAKAVATIEGGKVTGVKILDGGSGYSSSPKVTVPGHSEVTYVAVLSFSKELKKNGAIAEIKLK